jgi:Flp pilus assembly protein TadG
MSRLLGPARQQGLTTVETAVVGMLAMIVLLAVFEIARMLFVFNTLEEVTRRGARVAAVCQVNDPAIQQIAIFNRGSDASSLLRDLTSANVRVQYIDDNGNVVGDPVGDFGDIGYVRVSITNYQHRLMIPLFTRAFTVPGFATTIPRESLGVTREGFTTC